MDLKFSLGGASPDHGHAAHDHGGAPSGIPLPFAGATSLGQSFAPVSTSSKLDVVVRIDRSGEQPLVVGEVVTGDGVTYSRGEVACDPSAVDPGSPGNSPADFPAYSPEAIAALARAARSAIARAVAGLEGPLATAITAVDLSALGAPPIVALVLAELELPGASPTVTEALQARIGVNAGVPIRVA